MAIEANIGTSGSVVLTPDGLRKLEEELEYLKTVKRQEVAERIKTAIAFGDLSENAEYDEAKNEQAFMEGRILQIESMLRKAMVVDHAAINNENVGIGNIVRVEDLKTQKESEYTIVGATEADPVNRRISIESPVGQALYGARCGSTVQVQLPNGTRQMRILEIRTA